MNWMWNRKKKQPKVDSPGLKFPRGAKPKNEFKTWIKKCDDIFSKFIRLRDCGGKEGTGFCITSGRPITYDTCDAGHFIGREHYGVRFNEKNVHAQSRSDNRFHEGEKDSYAAEVLKRYGQDEMNKLLFFKTHGHKFQVFELKLIFDEYKVKVGLFK